MRYTRLLCLAMTNALLPACDEHDAATAERPAPIPATEIEVTEFEDHGVALQLELSRQHCFEGVNYGLSSSATASDDPLEVGEKGSAKVWAGPFVDGRWSPDDGITVMGAVDGNYEANIVAPHEWRMVGERLASDRADELRFAIDWEHLVVPREGGAALRTQERRIVALREGELHVLDWLDLPRGADGCDPSFAVDVVVVRDEPEALVDQRLDYEIWHVHTLPDGSELSSRTEVWAKHAKLAEFELEELRPTLAEPPSFAGSELEVAMLPVGSLRGRVRSDGDIDLLVDVELGMGLVDHGAAMQGSIARRGQHAFRLAPGQTLRLELPAASGSWQRKDGERALVVEGAEVLRDHSDALLVRVTLG